ncbi:ash family protein [Escherichia coli]
MNAPLVDTFRAVAKSTAGIGTPIIIMAHTALAVFLCVKHCYTPIMVGRAGES